MKWHFSDKHLSFTQITKGGRRKKTFERLEAAENEDGEKIGLIVNFPTPLLSAARNKAENNFRDKGK